MISDHYYFIFFFFIENYFFLFLFFSFSSHNPTFAQERSGRVEEVMKHQAAKLADLQQRLASLDAPKVVPVRKFQKKENNEKQKRERTIYSKE